GVSLKDENLLYTVRMALRNQLAAGDNLTKFSREQLSKADSRAIADVAVAVSSAEAGAFLLDHIQRTPEPRETLSRYLRHAARHAPAAKLDTLATYVQKEYGEDVDFQLALFKSVQEGAAQRGSRLPESAVAWGGVLAEKLLQAPEQQSDWTFTPLAGAETKNPWFVQRRASADGKNARFLCSLPPGGEQLTGIARSKAFEIPKTLEFYLAGHDGFPNKSAQKKNVVRLRLADTDAIIAEQFPPRNDMAQAVTWHLEKETGRHGYIEVTNADTDSAYAWL